MGELLHVSHIQGGRLRGVLSVDIKDVGTVEQLKNAIPTQHELPTCTDLTLFYRGINLGSQKQLALECLMQNLGAPRFSLRSVVDSPESGDLSLFVDMTHAEARIIKVNLPAGSTGADLEQAVCNHEAGGLHSSMFSLLEDIRKIRTDLELADYNLVSGSTVYSMWRSTALVIQLRWILWTWRTHLLSKQ